MTVKTWRLEEAKNRFSELVRRALRGAPQRVTRRGRDAVVIMSAADYERLVAPQDLVTFLQDSPLADALRRQDLTIERATDHGRDVTL